MNTWNLRKDANFCIKISKNLFWVPANSVSSEKKNDLYSVLYSFQMKRFKESGDNRILKLDYKNKIIWEFFDSPSDVVSKYSNGNCAVFCLWVNYYLSKYYKETGYIQIFRNSGTWHVLNYIKQEGCYYIIDPNSYIEKYKEHCPVEDGVFTTYAKSKMITGGVLKTTNLYDFISFYEKFVSLGNLKYLFIKIEDYKLPYFCIEHVLNGFKIYLNPEATIKVLNSYDKNIYELSYSKIIDSNLIPIKESSSENIWKTLMKMKSISQDENR